MLPRPVLRGKGLIDELKLKRKLPLLSPTRVVKTLESVDPYLPLVPNECFSTRPSQ
jgi:hypothetical protein